MQEGCGANGVDTGDSEEDHEKPIDEGESAVGNYLEAVVPSSAFAEGLRREARGHRRRNHH